MWTKVALASIALAVPALGQAASCEFIAELAYTQRSMFIDFVRRRQMPPSWSTARLDL